MSAAERQGTDIDLLFDIIGEWGSNRFGYSFKRAHFTEKAQSMGEAIGRPTEEVAAVYKAVVLEKMGESIGAVGPVELDLEQQVAVLRRIVLYLFSYGFPYGTDFPSGPDAMRASATHIAELLEVSMEEFYPMWASIISEAIEWSFEPIPEGIELPNDDDWRERRR